MVFKLVHVLPLGRLGCNRSLILNPDLENPIKHNWDTKLAPVVFCTRMFGITSLRIPSIAKMEHSQMS